MKVIMKNWIRPIGFAMAFPLLLSGCCTKNPEPPEKSGKEKVHVFEIKYQQTVSFSIGRDNFSVKLTDLKDEVSVDCSLVYFKDNTNGPKAIRVYADLSINLNDETQTLNVKSRPCGTERYNNDGKDLQEVIQDVDDIEKYGRTKRHYTFQDTYVDGTTIDRTNYTIYMFRAYPVKYLSPDSTKDDYKFIFVITSK